MDITEKSNITLEFDKIREELAKYARFKQSKQLCYNYGFFSCGSYSSCYSFTDTINYVLF